jgi:transcription termination/antitermination protein NusG
MTDEKILDAPETVFESMADNQILETPEVVFETILSDQISETPEEIAESNEEPSVLLPELVFLAKTADKEVAPVEAVIYRWYCLKVISGKERKICERIQKEIELNSWHDYVKSLVVPIEKVYKMRAGKKVAAERSILPGYILVEALPEKLRGELVKTIHDIQNVIHFLGKENPIPMTVAEANRLLGKVDEASAATEKHLEPFIVGETVKIIEGSFLDFIGEIQEIFEEKKKLKVSVKIFGRGTPMELSFAQVEKIV